MSTDVRRAVATIAGDSSRIADVMRHVGAVERTILLEHLRSLNIASWAVTVHRLATNPSTAGDISPEDADTARRIARRLVLEVAR